MTCSSRVDIHETDSLVAANPTAATPPRTVLLVHNRYRAGTPAGEDNAVDQEAAMLERSGIRVVRYERSNDEVAEGNPLAVLQAAATMSYSRRTVAELARLIDQTSPDVAHFHNTFPLITTSGYYACREAGVPVVQTLHNYRLLCARSTMYRDGRPCHLCTPRSFLPAVRHRCYRSTAGSSAVAWMLFSNWRRKVYTELVDQYIALTRFAARTFIGAGLKAESVSVKPNFVPAPGAPGDGGGGYVAFAGRLVEEKGVHTLLTAWRQVGNVRLKIIGSGPLEGALRQRAAEERLNVEFTGMLPRDQVGEQVARALFLVVPSEWYEGFPLTIVEAYGRGTPVLAARIGGLAELVRPGETGELFEPGEPDSLAGKALELLAHAELRGAMRRACRGWFDAEFTEERNVEALLAVYAKAAQALRAKARTA